MGLPPFLDLGDLRIHPLDGGLMGFGVEVQGQQRNFQLAVRPLLVQVGGRSLLVDPGFGPADPERRERFDLVEGPPLEEQCRALGLLDGPEFVVLTHLHFDHAAGALVRENLFGWGEERARFPQAIHVCHVDEWESALAARRGGKLASRLEAALGRSAFRWITGEKGELLPEFPQIRFRKTQGHTEGLMVLEFQGEGGRCVYPADLVPHRGFLRPKKDDLADRDPQCALREREEILEAAAKTGAFLWLYHDLGAVFGKLLGEKGRGVYRLQANHIPPEKP